MELSVVLPALHEAENLGVVIPALRKVLDRTGVDYEVLVVTAPADRDTQDAASRLNARIVIQETPGYGVASRAGLREARGRYVATLDADCSHDPSYVESLLRARHDADIVIASRYVVCGYAHMPFLRRQLSRILNAAYRQILSLPVRDLSSGYRLYRRSILADLDVQATHFDFLEEILVRAYMKGYRVREVPFHFRPRHEGYSKARLARLALAFTRTLARLWKLRNAPESADYEMRAFYSRMPIQRYWQRRRYKAILGFVDQQSRVLDIGCGSSVLLEALPRAVAADISLPKLRFRRNLGNPLVCASTFDLPFGSECFDVVVSSQLIEHVPKDPGIFQEYRRVLRPGGRLVLGTPDYGGLAWPFIEWWYKLLLPYADADGHISHYTMAELRETLDRAGFRYLAHRYILRGELIILAEKV